MKADVARCFRNDFEAQILYGWLDNPSNGMHSRKIAMIAMLVALAIATNYAMMPLYNIKLMDVVVFTGGFCFGPMAGALIGVLSWAVYGTLNPLGFSLHVWLATMFAESIYGLVGGFIKKSFSGQLSEFRSQRKRLCIFFATVGVLLTMVYDTITNIVFGYVSNWNVLFAVIVGFASFGIVHAASNALFFGLGCVPTIRAVMRVGGERPVIPEK